MYNDNRTKIGTKTIQQGAGLQKPDGSFGNGVTMKFNPPVAQAEQRQPQQQNFNNSYNTYVGNGVTAPKIQYEAPKGDENFSRILRNLARSRNAKMQLKYDTLNSNIYDQQQTRLAEAKNNMLDRLQKQSQFDATLQNGNEHFNRMMEYNRQKQQQLNALKNIMTPYQKAEIAQKGYTNRLKEYNKDDFNNLMPNGVADELSDSDFQKAKEYWLKTGNMPKFEATGKDGWFDNKYRVADTQQPQANTEQPKRQSNTLDPLDPAYQRAYRRYVLAKNKEIMGE